MDLQSEAIELQKIFHKDYKTYWEETEAIKNHLEARFKALNIQNVKPKGKLEMFQNMQYYMEHCQREGYITPQDWLEN